MRDQPLRTTVIGSYPFPGWLEFASQNLDAFGSADIAEMQDDAATVAIQDQVRAGLDVITDGEQTRFDFNLSFYGFLEGVRDSSSPQGSPGQASRLPRNFGPPAHDQRGKHEVTGELRAPHGLGTVEEFERLQRLAPRGEAANGFPQSGITLALDTRHSLKMSVPGPFTMSGRLLPNDRYPDRYALTEALLPVVRSELEALVAAGCDEICVDEPSMSCYGYKEDTKRFVDIFNRTVEPVVGKTRLCTHLCFGNFKGHAVGYRRYAPLFPDFLDLKVDELHLEMASREYAELEVIADVAKRMDVAVGIIDVKSYFIETPDLIADKVRSCLEHAPADRLVFAPDCGLSQTARWAARQKLENMVAGVHAVRKDLGL